MFSALLSTIIQREGLAVVGHDGIDERLSDVDHAVLFFSGDANRLAESDDVAVVLPELVKAFGGVLTPFVVDRDSERDLQRRYRFNSFPSLVVLRRGGYLGTIQGVRDWADYLEEIAAILSREPSTPPPFKFPEGCWSAPSELTH